MTEAEKLKVQIETFQVALQVVRDGVGEPYCEYPVGLARYVERRIDWQVGMLRVALKQLERKATVSGNPSVASPQGTPPQAGVVQA